jgi:hypothetical protein
MENEKLKIYNFLKRNDEHLFNLFEWHDTLRHLANDIRESDMDHDLEVIIRDIMDRLKVEIGERMTAIYP